MKTLEEATLPIHAPLRISGWLGQYTFSGFLTCISASCIYFGVANFIGGKAHNSSMWWFAIIAAALAFALGILERRRLRYTVFQTSDTAAENYRRVLEVVVSNAWEISADTAGKLIAARVKAPWTALTWGELVTVQFVGTQVGINCIGDPYAGRNGSWTDKARTKTEMDMVLRALRVI